MRKIALGICKVWVGLGKYMEGEEGGGVGESGRQSEGCDLPPSSSKMPRSGATQPVSQADDTEATTPCLTGGTRGVLEHPAAPA